MRLAPTAIVRDEPPPDDLLLVVRGRQNSLSDANLERATTDTWQSYQFFGLSVFAAPDDDLVALSERQLAVRRRSQVRVARCGTLRDAGFEVTPTFSNPDHFSIVLADVTAETFERLRSVFSEAIANPGYQPAR
jgi:hypothetical protein